MRMKSRQGKSLEMSLFGPNGATPRGSTASRTLPSCSQSKSNSLLIYAERDGHNRVCTNYGSPFCKWRVVFATVAGHLLYYLVKEVLPGGLGASGFKVLWSLLRFVAAKVRCNLLAGAVPSGTGVMLWAQSDQFWYEGRLTGSLLLKDLTAVN
jgi:hypothetical protein